MAENISTISYGVTGDAQVSSYDYTSIAAWEAATDYDLVTSTTTEIGECYATSGGYYAENITIAGATVSTDYYRVLRAATGNRHVGIYADGGQTSGTDFVVVYPNTGKIFTIQEKHFHLGEGMVLHMGTGHGSSDECVRIGTSSENCRGLLLDSCICWCQDTAADTDGVYAGNYDVGVDPNPVTISNSLFIGFQRSGIHLQQYYTGPAGRQHYFTIVNNTFYDCGATVTRTGAIGWDIRDAQSEIEVSIINCIDAGNGQGDQSMEYTYSVGADHEPIDVSSSSNYSIHVSAVDWYGTFPDHTVLDSFVDSDPGASGTNAWVNSIPNNMIPVNNSNNDMLDAGVGPSANSLVPTWDALGDTRSGSTTDLGFILAPAAVVRRNRAMCT
jgi:hypothetical protein